MTTSDRGARHASARSLLKIVGWIGLVMTPITCASGMGSCYPSDGSGKPDHLGAAYVFGAITLIAWLAMIFIPKAIPPKPPPPLPQARVIDRDDST